MIYSAIVKETAKMISLSKISILYMVQLIMASKTRIQSIEYNSMKNINPINSFSLKTKSANFYLRNSMKIL